MGILEDYHEIYPWGSDDHFKLLAAYREEDGALYEVMRQLKLYSKEAYQHSLRVFDGAVRLCRERYEEHAFHVGKAALLHDVGKLVIPLDILNKNGRLSSVERRAVQKHVCEGIRILEDKGVMMHPFVKRGVLEHHERMDGTGYPMGLRGEHLWEPGVLIAISDVFDALTHDRVYKRRIDALEAMQIIQYEFSASRMRGR